MQRHSGNGTGRVPRVRRLAAPLAIAAATACGGGATGPSIAADAFQFTAYNRIEQTGADTAALETITVMFDVFVTTAAGTQKNLANVKSMSIAWPDGTTPTPVPTTFVSVAGALTSHAEAQSAQGLAAGTYTLTVSFTNGSSITREFVVDGHQMDRPLIHTMTATPDSVSLSWTAPAQSADWRLYLWQGSTAGDDSTAVFITSKGHTAGSASASGKVTYSLAPSGAYVLGLLLSDRLNQRMVYIPFTAP